MKFEVRQPEEGLLRRSASSELLRLMEDESFEMLFFTAGNKRETICYAAFSRWKDGDGSYFLNCVFTVEQYRGQGRCKALLEYCAKYFSKLGHKDVLAKLYCLPQKAQEYDHVLHHCGCLPLNRSDSLCVYELMDLYQSEDMEIFFNRGKRLPHILSYTDLPKELIDGLKNIGKKGFSASEKRCSRFFVTKERLEGMMVAARGGNLLYISRVWLSSKLNTEKQEMIFQMMLADSILELEGGYPKNLRVAFYQDHESEGDPLWELFDPPSATFLIMEYMMLLDKKERRA